MAQASTPNGQGLDSLDCLHEITICIMKARSFGGGRRDTMASIVSWAGIPVPNPMHLSCCIHRQILISSPSIVAKERLFRSDYLH